MTWTAAVCDIISPALLYGTTVCRAQDNAACGCHLKKAIRLKSDKTSFNNLPPAYGGSGSSFSCNFSCAQPTCESGQPVCKIEGVRSHTCGDQFSV